MGLTRKIAEQFEQECKNYFYSRWYYQDFAGQKGGITSLCKTIGQDSHSDHVKIQREFFFLNNSDFIKNKQLRRMTWGRDIEKYDIFVLQHLTPIMINYSINKAMFVAGLTEQGIIANNIYKLNTKTLIWQRS